MEIELVGRDEEIAAVDALLDAQKLRLACVGLCFTRSEDFPVPLRRFEVSLFFGKGCPELFHRLKPFGFT